MITATPTTYEHIALDERGIPWIKAANTKVVELVADVKAHGWSPEQPVLLPGRETALGGKVEEVAPQTPRRSPEPRRGGLEPEPRARIAAEGKRHDRRDANHL